MTFLIKISLIGSISLFAVVNTIQHYFGKDFWIILVSSLLGIATYLFFGHTISSKDNKETWRSFSEDSLSKGINFIV